MTEIKNRGVEDVCIPVSDGLKGLSGSHQHRVGVRRGGNLAMTPLWENARSEFVPFLEFDVEIRRVICSTNAIESIDARYWRAVRAGGHSPSEQAALKCLYLATPCTGRAHEPKEGGSRH